MQVIPLSQIPAQTLNVVLGGATAARGATTARGATAASGQHCTIAIYWRQKRLYLDLSVNSVVICVGRICQNRSDIVQSKSQNFSGSLHFFDLEGDREPHFERLYNGKSGRWVLFYIEAGEEVPIKLRY